MPYSFTITKNFSNYRVDKFLTQQFPEFSRAYIQKLITKGKIRVNNKIVKSHYQLKEKDSVKVNIAPPAKISLEPDSSIKLNIIYEDKNVIVINKPAGLVVHPSATHKSKTLANALLAYFPEIKNVGEDKLRPGIVHRLDKDTSGLIVVAKNNESFQFLKNLFKNKQVEKRYLALVNGNLSPHQNAAGVSPWCGDLSKTKGKISLKISRSKSTPTKQATSLAVGREALTHYKIIKGFKGYDLVEARPKTGRMHQIRVHFSALGHPVVGDAKYGHKNQNQFPALNRYFLHSYYLKFNLPNGRLKEFKIELPEELKNCLKTLTEADI